MKNYVITLSQHFLKGHPKAGEPTYFADKLRKGLGGYDAELSDEWGVWAGELPAKIHTIRGNYDLWARRIKEVQEGEAVLSIRQWSGKPYNSPQTTLATLTAAVGVGIQKITICNPVTGLEAYVDGKQVDIPTLARNDGLSRDDFEAWFAPHFKKSNIFEGVVIHFTDFRY